MATIVCPHCNKVQMYFKRSNLGILCDYCEKEYIVYGKPFDNGITTLIDTWKMEDIDKLLSFTIVPEKDKKILREIFERWIDEKYMYEYFIR